MRRVKLPIWYRRLMVEFYGWLSGRCLIRIAKHAAAVLDYTLADQARTVINAGYDAGWDGSPASKLTPMREWRRFAAAGLCSEERGTNPS